MKKWLSFLVLSVLVLALAACGADDKDNKDESTASKEDEPKEETTTLTVGASDNPHAVILEQAKPLLADKGIDLKIETYTDYVLPN